MPWFRSGRQEVDFVALDSCSRAECAVQVCMSLVALSTAEREVKPLAKADTCRYFGIGKAWIITMSEEKLISRDGLEIRVVPAWKWLLAEE